MTTRRRDDTRGFIPAWFVASCHVRHRAMPLSIHVIEMKETKPFFVIRKYRSILRAAIIVESVSFIVSLTDIIVAGNLIGREALTAIGLVAPFMGVLSFLGSVVNSGTLVNYSYLIGRFDRRRANEFFSQGVYMSLVGGAAYALVLLLLREKFVAFCFETAEARQVAREYFSFILFYFLLQPFSVVLENIVVADGGEKLSVLANITLIVGNIILSILFAVRWGVRGIAMASVTSLILFILILLLHLFSGSNTLRLVRHWRKQDFLRIVKTGIVKASNYALDALMQMILDILVLSYYDAKALILVVLVQKYLGLTTFFIGLSMAAQPLIGTLLGENNTKALRILMKTVFFDISAIALLMSLLTLWQAPFIAWAFGIDNTALLLRASTALRIIGASLPFQAILILFFIYYVLIDKQLPAFRICLRKNIICPLLFSVLFTVLLGNENGLWTGLALAPAAALLISAGHILLRYGKEQFPLLLREDPERHIFIYDFEITPENAVGISQIAQSV
ncbi:MAG: MATE family efflux transporter, partial [Eubacteriales bacterium]|nr:MATE family efflux transporter [Eubacteriales bacterium]